MSPRGWFWASGLLFVSVLAWMVATRPAGLVPVHFGTGGEPDRWVTPERAITEIGLVGAGMFVLMWGLAEWMGRVPWSLINLPRKEQWEPHQPWVRRRAREDLHLVGVWTMLLLAGLAWVVWHEAERPEPGFGLGGVLVGVMVVLLVGGMVLRLRPYLGSPDELPPGTFDE